MTDKQIIIDGIDVSGCYQYMPRYMEDYDIDTLDYCRYYFKPCKDVDVKYCYYKQLKRKEQECEELKKRLESFQKDYSKLYQVVENKGYIKELDQLKIENNQFKQILVEIKEIAETAAKCLYATKSDDYTDGYRWLGIKILQKISESEG